MNKYLYLPILSIFLFTGCTPSQPSRIDSYGNTQAANTNQATNNNLTKPTATNMVTVKTTKGDITLELYANEATKTVENFLKLAKEGFYDKVKFHRVIPDFMIQTGDPQAKGVEGKDFTYGSNPSLPIAGTGGPGYQFADEFNASLRFDKPGVLAMANSGPNTNGSQFFITHVPTPHLNDAHTIFGQVTAGQDVVNAIEQGDEIVSITIQ